MRIYREEIFGPVLVVVRARNFDEALHLVNGHEFGNGTSIFTRDGGAAREFVQAGAGRHGGHQRADPRADGLPQLRRLEALAVRRPRTCTARDGVRFYTRLKTVTARWPSGLRGGSEFVMPTLD